MSDAQRSETAALVSEPEMVERVRVALGSSSDFRRALWVMLNDETPRHRDDARKAALLELVAVDLSAAPEPTDVPAPAMPGATYAQRPPTFR